jgi:flagellar biosynthesis/type III secretory pathway protein FliH
MQNEAPNLLNQLGRDASFHIQSDPELSPGGARIETQLGAIDASVETRFAAFADALAEWAGEEASVDVIRP